MNETPDNIATAQEAAAAQRRNRMQLLGIMMIGFLTLGASYLMFYVVQGSENWGTTNNGEFVQPTVNTAELGWQAEGINRRWWLWVVTTDCEQSCQQTVQNMRALHILLNREADRVRRGYTVRDRVIQTQPDWMAQFPELALVNIADAKPLTDGVYIVDPNGNLVFRYAMDTNPKLVLQDLKKLLKVSHIG